MSPSILWDRWTASHVCVAVIPHGQTGRAQLDRATERPITNHLSFISPQVWVFGGLLVCPTSLSSGFLSSSASSFCSFFFLVFYVYSYFVVLSWLWGLAAGRRRNKLRKKGEGGLVVVRRGGQIKGAGADSSSIQTQQWSEPWCCMLYIYSKRHILTVSPPTHTPVSFRSGQLAKHKGEKCATGAIKQGTSCYSSVSIINWRHN